jgi:hypothetical protein
LTGEPVDFAFSTLERWLYAAREGGADPFGTLRPKRRSDLGIVKVQLPGA